MSHYQFKQQNPSSQRITTSEVNCTMNKTTYTPEPVQRNLHQILLTVEGKKPNTICGSTHTAFLGPSSLLSPIDYYLLNYTTMLHLYPINIFMLIVLLNLVIACLPPLSCILTAHNFPLILICFIQIPHVKSSTRIFIL